MTSTNLGLESVRAQGGKPIALHMSSTFRHVLNGPNVSKEDRFFQLVTGEAHPFGNFAVLQNSNDIDGVKDMLPPLLDCGAPAAVILLSEASKDVDDLLANHGFMKAEVMPGMAIDLNELAKTSMPDGYEFVRVTSERTGADWVVCASAGYGVPVPITDLFSVRALGGAQLSEDAIVQWFAIKKGDRFVATSMMILNDGVAGIYWVATLEEERGKGLGAHVTAEPLRRARESGYSTGVLQASEPGFPVYKRLGFEQLCGLPLYARMPQ